MTKTSSPITPAAYINRLTAGMQAKKYKGGQAARIKAQTSRIFDDHFKPLKAQYQDNWDKEQPILEAIVEKVRTDFNDWD